MKFPKKVYLPALILLILVVSLFITYDRAEATPQIYIDDKMVSCDQPPSIENGRTLVPLRVISESLGASVTWDDNTKTVVATKGNTSVSLQIGNQESLINNEKIKLDVCPKIINGRTFVPLRFVSEAFNCDVNWDESSKTVKIYQKQIVDPMKISYSNGDSYYGILKDEIRSDKGKYTWLDGTVFDGTWADNEMLNGILEYPSKHQYNGAYVNNVRSGTGTYVWPNGDKYVGRWADDTMEGQGIYYFANGDQYYGAWSNGMMNGNGTYTFSNGKILTGVWTNNILSN